ncbi:hypothetical protein BC827DRAFT_1152554 [Russula dissimulans]|nr:hypothetical protein BC827DRAFT_1152554 [Russula dissimulans]
MFCGPSRFVWFTIGSFATWTWMYHHHNHHHHHCDHKGWAWSRRVEYGDGDRTRSDRVDDASTPTQGNASSSSSPDSPDYAEWRWQQQQQLREWRPAPTFSSQGAHTPTGSGRFDAHVLGSSTAVGLNGSGSGTSPQREPGVAAAAAAAGTVTAVKTTFPTDSDAERLRQIGRNAEETISGMSEATIDSVMGALQRLKDRMAERRGQQQSQNTEHQEANPAPAPPPEEPPRPRHWV